MSQHVLATEQLTIRHSQKLLGRPVVLQYRVILALYMSSSSAIYQPLIAQATCTSFYS